MPIHMSRENLPARGMPMGMGPRLPWGFVMPAAAQMGLGVVNRMSQPARLEVSDQAPPGSHPSSAPVYRHMDQRSLDATRILDFGAPAPMRVVEYAPSPYRPTEAPAAAQNNVALGGRFMGVF